MFIIYDVEATKQGQFVGFKNTETNHIEYIDLKNRKELVNYFNKNKNYTFVGYNNFGYDNKVLNYCMSYNNLTSENILKFSDGIINKTINVKTCEYNILSTSIVNIDLLYMANKKMGLKLKSFANYNYLFKNSLSSENLEMLKKYNSEDLELTQKIFEDEFLEEYNISLYLSNYLGFGDIPHNNLTISRFLKEKAKYNNDFDFSKCLDKIAIDEDLKSLATKLISNKKVTQIYTEDRILIKKGGLHFPISDDFEKQGIKYFEKCFNYDYSSFYPNLYIDTLDFFSDDTKVFLRNILAERLEAKKTGDEKKNKAFKLFINSIYGQLKKINKQYMFAVAILGQVLFVQLLRDNNLTLNDVVELNTDGILLKNKLENIKNISNIEIEEDVFTNVYHKNSNNKTYTLNGKPVSKGQLLGGNEYTNKLAFRDLSACLYDGKIYNCFIVKHKNEDEIDQIKYYKFKNIEDIRNYKLGHNGILMPKAVLIEALKNNVLEEIEEYNYEDITSIVTELFNCYLQENNDYKLYVNGVFELKSKSKELNELYNKYKNDLYLLPNEKDIFIQHKDKSVHNELAFYKNQKPKGLFVVPVNEFVVVEANHDELTNRQVKEILVNKTSKYFIYKNPKISMKLKSLKGLKYYKDLSVCSVTNIDEVELINEELPEVFYKIVPNEQVQDLDFVGMNKEALNEKRRIEKKKKKVVTEKSKEELTEEARIRRSNYLDDKQLTINFNGLIEFLSILDPVTSQCNDYGSPKFVKFPKELRAIKRDKQEKNYIPSTIYYSLLNQKFKSDMSGKYDRDDLKKFFTRLNGSGHCAYYSVFNFEPKKSLYQNKVTSKKITNETAKSTCILPMDFDDISEEDYKQIKQRFTDLGIETLDVFTGHGYQMIILLNKYCNDKEVLRKFTNLLAKKGFPVDEAIVDPARIMRLPYTYNCKCLDKNSKYYGKEEPILVEVVNKTRNRYFVNDIFNKILSLESVEEIVNEKAVIRDKELDKERELEREREFEKELERAFKVKSEREFKVVTKKELEEIEKLERELERRFEALEELEKAVEQSNRELREREREIKAKAKAKAKDRVQVTEEVENQEDKILNFIEPKVLSNNNLRKLQDLYGRTGIDILEFEPAIQNILTGTREGIRHDVLLFLMPYFKNHKKYSFERIEDIFVIWGGLCRPAMSVNEIKTQVKSLYSYEYMTAPYGKYSASLKKEYGAFKLNLNNNRNDKIYVTNDIIKNFINMPSKALKVYLSLLLNNSETGVNIFTGRDIEKISGISLRTFCRSMKYLIKHKYVKLRKRCKKNSEKYEYSINLELMNFNKVKYGYVTLSQDTTKKAINGLTTGEMYTWLYVSMVQGASNQVCTLNQYYIGLRTKRKNTTISNITSSLARKGFIIKETEWYIKNIGCDIYMQRCKYDVINISYGNRKLA